jgi:DNA-binding CsgD family transcriptional regulator
VGNESAPLRVSSNERRSRYSEGFAALTAAHAARRKRRGQPIMKMPLLASDDFAAPQAWLLRDALRGLDLGMALVDEGAQIMALNEEARALLRGGDGLLVRESRLTAIIAAEARRLEALIVAATRSTEDAAAPLGGGTMRISRLPPKGGLCLLVSPLRSPAAPRAIILLQEGPPRPLVDASPLARRFDLTRTEARVAVQLAHGSDLRGAAMALGVGINTVRSHLQRIFEKTGTRRQVDLVRLILAESLIAGDE